MAADVTVAEAAHLSLVAGVPQTVRLTGAGKYVDVVGHINAFGAKIFFAVENREDKLPSVVVEGDNLNLAKYPQRVRVPAPRDVWLRVVSDYDVDLSVVKNSIPFLPRGFPAIRGDVDEYDYSSALYDSYATLYDGS